MANCRPNSPPVCPSKKKSKLLINCSAVLEQQICDGLAPAMFCGGSNGDF